MDIFPADGDLSAHFITCPVCRDTYNLTDRLPIYIPCGHTFCTQCATSLIANERFLTANIAISCPVCRKRHGAQRTKELPLGFPKNLQLITVVEKVLRGEKRVENARPRLQKIKCKDCQVEVTADSCVKCDCNGEEEGEAETQDLLKRDITKLICVDCANQSHKEHVFEDPKKIKKQYETRETAKNLVDSIDRVKEKMEKDLKEQQKSRKHLELLVRLMKKSKAYLENLAESQHLYKDKQMYFKALEEMEQNFDLMEEENKKRHKIFQDSETFLSLLINQHDLEDHTNVVFIKSRPPVRARPLPPPHEPEADDAVIIIEDPLAYERERFRQMELMDDLERMPGLPGLAERIRDELERRPGVPRLAERIRDQLLRARANMLLPPMAVVVEDDSDESDDEQPVRRARREVPPARQRRAPRGRPRRLAAPRNNPNEDQAAARRRRAAARLQRN